MPKKRRSTTYENKPSKQLQQQPEIQSSFKSLSKGKCKQSKIKSSIADNKQNLKYNIKAIAKENVKNIQIFQNIKTVLDKQAPAAFKELHSPLSDQKPCTSKRCPCKMKCSEKPNNTKNFLADQTALNFISINKKSRNAVLDTHTRLNKRNANIHKSSTIWTKFPVDYAKTCTNKIPITKPTSVYRPGTSYSDVLFSAGPSCSVNIKTMASDSIIETNLALPQLRPLQPLEVKNSRNEEGTVFSSASQQVNLNFCTESRQDKCAIKLFAPKKLLPRLLHEEFMFQAESKDSTDKTNIDSKLHIAVCEDDCKETHCSNLSVMNIVLEDEIIEKNEDMSICSINMESSAEQGRHETKEVENVVIATCTVGQELEYLQNNLKRLISESRDCEENVFKLDIPLWNFIELDEGPEIYPRFSKQFNDEKYLMAEDMANLGFKLSRGN